MENGVKGLLIAAGVTIAALTISMGFYYVRVSVKAGNGNAIVAAKEFDNFSQTLNREWDGKIVSGVSVWHCIKEYGDCVIVKTIRNPEGFKDFSTDPDSDNFIPDNGIFYCQTTAKGDSIVIEFNQKEKVNGV